MGFVVIAIGCGAVLLGRSLWSDGALTHAVALHATLMITAWGVLLPLGAILARYYKIMPGQPYPAVVENLFWWRWHRGLQYGGIALATFALAVILRETGGRVETPHGWCGLAVMTLAWLQVLSAAVRGTKGGPTDARADPADPATWRGDHYDMTMRRRRFEAWHKPVGWAVLGLAGVTILLGVDLVGAPPWLFVVAGLLQGAVVCAILDGRLRRRWVDTYAALWGPDPVHPGNRRTGKGCYGRVQRP